LLQGFLLFSAIKRYLGFSDKNGPKIGEIWRRNNGTWHDSGKPVKIIHVENGIVKFDLTPSRSYPCVIEEHVESFREKYNRLL
jgi:hypothetical protein